MNKILFRKLLFIDICHIQRNEFINICFCPSCLPAAPSLPHHAQPPLLPASPPESAFSPVDEPQGHITTTLGADIL